MLDMKVFNELKKYDVDELKRKLSAIHGQTPAAQAERIQILRTAGMNDELARIFLSVILGQPDETGTRIDY